MVNLPLNFKLTEFMKAFCLVVGGARDSHEEKSPIKSINVVSMNLRPIFCLRELSATYSNGLATRRLVPIGRDVRGSLCYGLLINAFFGFDTFSLG